MTTTKKPAPPQNRLPANASSTAQFTALLDPFGVDCGYCGAVAGQQCTNLWTGRPMARAISHPRRIVAAEKAVQR